MMINRKVTYELYSVSIVEQVSLSIDNKTILNNNDNDNLVIPMNFQNSKHEIQFYQSSSHVHDNDHESIHK